MLPGLGPLLLLCQVATAAATSPQWSHISSAHMPKMYAAATKHHSSTNRKGRKFPWPTQLAMKGQWWSIWTTHVPQALQWCACGGLAAAQYLHQLQCCKAP